MLTVFLQFAQADSGDAAGAAGAVLFVLGMVCVGIISILFYFLPPIIAGLRGHQNTAAIFILTLLLGWSFIGWVAALVWAFTAIEPTHHRHYHDHRS